MSLVYFETCRCRPALVCLPTDSPFNKACLPATHPTSLPPPLKPFQLPSPSHRADPILPILPLWRLNPSQQTCLPTSRTTLHTPSRPAYPPITLTSHAPLPAYLPALICLPAYLYVDPYPGPAYQLTLYMQPAYLSTLPDPLSWPAAVVTSLPLPFCLPACQPIDPSRLVCLRATQPPYPLSLAVNRCRCRCPPVSRATWADKEKDKKEGFVESKG